MYFWFRLLSRWPLGVLHAFGHVLGWTAWLLSPTYRQRFLENVAQAQIPLKHALGAVGHAGCMSTELPRLWLGAMPAVRWQGDAVVDAAYACGKGVIFLTPHLGCFEITAQALAQRYSPRFGALTVLFRPARQAGLAQVMAHARGRDGLETAPTTLAGVRQMIKALRKGRAVGLLPDQVPPEGMGQWAPFFGKPAYTMTLAARLAQQKGAQIVLIWGERLPWGQGFELHARELAQPLSDDLDAAVLQINQAMETLVQSCPSQYLWGYARYKAPRKEL
jgi:KDO2-lipid IV(A) lauroyltransferase